MRVISSGVPLPGRIWAVLFCGGISTAMVVTNIQDYASGRASAVAFAPLAAVVLILMTVAYRLARWSFHADASGLVIRNFLTTRRVPLAQITGFDVGQRFSSSLYYVWVITPSGTFPISIYHRRTRLFLKGLCDRADELAGWLEDARGEQSAGDG